MSVTIFLIIALVAIVAIYFLFYKYRPSSIAGDHHDHHHESSEGVCCGRHVVCEKGYDSLYFEDEELDRFKERDENDYTDEEVEEFRQVLYTMKEEEVSTWVKCLGSRGIALPQQVKDEILLMLQ